MIIVGQDKDIIVNFDKVHDLWIDDNNHEFYETDEENDRYDYEILADDETLGYYKTEARAKEILEEIGYLYVINKAGSTIDSEYRKSVRYEMPKE